MIVNKLKEKYQPLLDKVDYKKINNGNLNPDVYLFQKWSYKVGRGWYGFSLSNNVPFIWAQIIDEFLEWLNKECPNFEIHQIKLKYGFLRFYVDLVDLFPENTYLEIQNQIDQLEEWLGHKDLIY